MRHFLFGLFGLLFLPTAYLLGYLVKVNYLTRGDVYVIFASIFLGVMFYLVSKDNEE